VPRVDAYIGVGGNLGDAMATVQQALQALAALPATQLLRPSSLYRTAPVDSSGPDYINAVAHIRTALTPLDLLDHLQALESHAGRLRPYLNAPRTLDLDILLYGDRHIHTDRLTVPHPRMMQRAFVLAPLAEIAPQLVSASQLAAVAGQGVQRLS
jgi:2-amino-4-hydroxy-6-hydroxymethyldihydropteridine diphosphokinase